VSEPESGSRGFFERVAGLIREARRRKVWVTAAAYAALTIGLIEISGAVSEALLFPDWTDRLVTFLLILGFPIVLVMAWIFDFEKGGLKRTESLAELEKATRTESSPGRGNLILDTPPLPDPVSRRRRSFRSPDGSEGAGAAIGPVDPDRLKRAALGHVRHELRTPINAILGYSEMLLEDEDDEEVRSDLGRIHQSGRRLLTLIDDILNPDRLAGSIDRDIESFAAQIEADLRTPINAVIGYGEMLLEGQREEGRDVLVPDLERIVTAARTLLENSADIVRIATRAPGVGESDGTTRLADSSELTKDVLARLGSSAEGAGSPAEGQGTLLVVDDNETNRDLLTRQLARHGYVVDTASDGREALERLASRDFDLVLLDVIMPGMDGVETLRHLKSDDRFRDIPVIMLSSLDEVESAVACIEAGAEEFITKPAQPTLLEARIAANLEVRQLRERERIYRRRIESDAETIERLLLSAFPAEFARRIQAGETRIVTPLPQVTVLHAALAADFPRSGDRLPDGLERLSELYSLFESRARAMGIGMVMGGRSGFVAAVSHSNGSDADGTQRAPGAVAIGELATAFRAEARPERADAGHIFRFGIHAGPAVAAMLGGERPRFDVWGDAVDTAGLLAQAAEPGTVLVSPAARARLADRFVLDPGRVVQIAGLGQIRPHLLTDEVVTHAS
jgi:CheY-like chemotaxis protein/signal transduction histidine kinase